MSVGSKIDIFSLLNRAGESTQATGKVVRVDSVPVSQQKSVAIVKPGQVVRPVYVNGVAYYNTLVEYTDEGSQEKKKKTTGYVKKEDFDTLTVSTVPIPANFAGLEAEMIPTRLENQLFRIYETTEDENYVTVRARHVWYDNLQNYTLWEPTEGTAYSGAAACRNVLLNAVSEVSSDVASDCTDVQTFKKDELARKNLVEAFLDPERGICAKYGLSLIRYNWDFYCLKEVGYDRGLVIQNGKNLLGVERKENIEHVATRIVPIGKDNSGNIVWLNNNGLKYVDSQYIGDYSYPRVEIFDTKLQIGKDDTTAENIQSKLLQAAQKRFSEDRVDLPEVEMTIDFLSLGDTEEYSQYRGLDKVYLYDIITIKDTIRGYQYSAQVVGVEHDILTGMLNSVTLGKLQNWDGVRKIAVWQVPEVDGTNIRLKSIFAGAFEPGAIQSADLAEAIIQYAHFATATIDALTADSIDAVTARIHDIIAGSITADDIQAGSITTETLASGIITTDKLAAGAVTTDKLAAGSVNAGNIAAYAITAEKLSSGSVTADKIAAGAINASKINAEDITAINAKLGTANIASAVVESADINFAHIKDLNAQSAYFGQTIFDEAVGGKLYVPRLAVGYAQMLGATISDLVIQASNDNFYKLDVDLAGNVTATQITPTAEEIEQGYTNDGRTIYMGTDILATDLNTQNIYASHGLMDEITANIINVDKLFAREATISKINALDLSSNTYIRSVVGDWVSGSTITQTINSINTRITELGYGTFFYSETEPSHEGLVAGDVWIKPTDSNSWGDIAQFTWQDLIDRGMTWDEVLGKYEMYCWTGQRWKLLYDSTINASLQTQINQNAAAITLKADQSTVNILSGEVTEFAGILEVQSQEITAAVQVVNAKTSNFVQETDPSLEYEIHMGDMWTKATGNGTWRDVATKTWRQISGYTWSDIGGSKVYVWNGAEWVMTSDRAVEKTVNAELKVAEGKVALLAEETVDLGDRILRNYAEIIVQSDRITQEVARASSAEANKIDKTTQYQTADSIVSEAVRQSQTSAQGLYIAKTSVLQTADAIVSEAVQESISQASGLYLAKTTVYQTADSIVSEAVRQSSASASSSYIAKTTSYQTADSIVNEAVRQSAVSAANGYIAKTQSYQTADAIVNTAQAYTNNQLTNYSTTTQTSQMISAYVGENAYGKVSGISIVTAGIDISGSQYVNIASGGWFKVQTGDFLIDTSVEANGYVMLSGSTSAENAGFRLRKNGELTITKLIALSEEGVASEVNLRTAGLWKLNYRTVKSYTESGGYCTGMTFSDGTAVNFKSAASVTLTGTWSGNAFTVTNSGNDRTSTTGEISLSRYAQAGISDDNKVQAVAMAQGEIRVSGWIEANDVFNKGWNACRNNSENVTRYTRNATPYGGGTTHYYKDGDHYVSCGTGWYQTALDNNCYHLPDPK